MAASCVGLISVASGIALPQGTSTVAALTAIVGLVPYRNGVVPARVRQRRSGKQGGSDKNDGLLHGVSPLCRKWQADVLMPAGWLQYCKFLQCTVRNIPKWWK